MPVFVDCWTPCLYLSSIWNVILILMLPCASPMIYPVVLQSYSSTPGGWPMQAVDTSYLCHLAVLAARRITVSIVQCRLTVSSWPTVCDEDITIMRATEVDWESKAKAKKIAKSRQLLQILINIYNDKRFCANQSAMITTNGRLTQLVRVCMFHRNKLSTTNILTHLTGC